MSFRDKPVIILHTDFISCPSHNYPTQCGYLYVWNQSNTTNLKLVFVPLWCLSFLSFKKKLLFQEGLTFPCNHTIGNVQLLTTCFIFKRDILTLTGGRRRETFVSFFSSPAIFSCRASQMVRFSAHMVMFLRDHHFWPDWEKKHIKVARC